jgi:hypothetical protein
MPTVTWARVDPARRAAIIEAAEDEFGAHGFSRGSLNVIARRAGVAKGMPRMFGATSVRTRTPTRCCRCC